MTSATEIKEALEEFLEMLESDREMIIKGHQGNSADVIIKNYISDLSELINNIEVD